VRSYFCAVDIADLYISCRHDPPVRTRSESPDLMMRPRATCLEDLSR